MDPHAFVIVIVIVGGDGDFVFFSGHAKESCTNTQTFHFFSDIHSFRSLLTGTCWGWPIRRQTGTACRASSAMQIEMKARLEMVSCSVLVLEKSPCRVFVFMGG